MPFERLQRRQFMMLLGGAAAWPRKTRAQQTKLPSIAFSDVLSVAKQRVAAHTAPDEKATIELD
jgi:hypothetical protein